MKKVLLLSLGFLPAVLFAQSRPNSTTVKINPGKPVSASMTPTQDVANPSKSKSKKYSINNNYIINLFPK